MAQLFEQEKHSQTNDITGGELGGGRGGGGGGRGGGGGGRGRGGCGGNRGKVGQEEKGQGVVVIVRELGFGIRVWGLWFQACLFRKYQSTGSR